MEIPHIIRGGQQTDQRGQLCYNNEFDLAKVKRIYTIENWSTETRRGWQGHKIEKRWFSAVTGTFKIELRAINDWKNPSQDCKLFIFELSSDELDVLCVPEGYVSKIVSLESGSKLLVFADHLLGEVKDEYKFDIEYFNE